MERDQEIVQLRNDANSLLFKAEDVANITNSEEEARATEFLAQAKRRYKIVDEKRKSYVKPIKDTIDLINADFKSILEPLEEVEVIVKKGMVAYRNSEDMKRKEAERLEAEAKARQAAEVIKENGITTKTVEQASEANKELVEAQEAAPKRVETISGSTTYRKEWKFSIENVSDIPEGVKTELLNLAITKGLLETVVRNRVKNGERTISGVKIWEESVPVIRS